MVYKKDLVPDDPASRTMTYFVSLREAMAKTVNNAALEETKKVVGCRIVSYLASCFLNNRFTALAAYIIKCDISITGEKVSGLKI